MAEAARSPIPAQATPLDANQPTARDAALATPGSRWAVAVLLFIALVLRLAHWWAVRRVPFVASLAVDSAEYDRWAQSIAAGDWLGHGVFFQAPLYPYLLALIYKLFGHHLDAVYLTQIAAAVGGCYALARAGRVMIGPREGLLAAGLAAVYGPFLFYDVQLLKESFAVTVTCFLLWALATARRRTAGSAAWLTAGVFAGVLALLRENALLAAPALLLLTWPPAVGKERWRRCARHSALFLLGAALPLLPVALRNGMVGGSYLPTTFQGGVNFYIGNNAHADGTYRPIVAGKQIPELERREPIRLAQQEVGRTLTSGEVSGFWMRKALAWARSHPATFARLQLRKLGLFWSWYEWPDTVDYYDIRSQSPVFRLPLLEFGGATLLALAGLVLSRGGRGPLLPATLFVAAWALATVVFFVFARYRLPAVPALLLLGALPLATLAKAFGDRTLLTRPRARLSTVALTAWCLAAFVMPRCMGFAPRMDLVHYNLARLAEEAGQPLVAQAEYRATLELDPHAFLAWLNLGTQAARARQWQAALVCVQRAAALAPDSDDAESNLGGVYLAIGRLDAARAHLDRALALNPGSIQALQNAAVLRLQAGDVAGAAALNRRLLAFDPENPAARRLARRLAAQGAPTR
jgi:tetratricopeptide (TPR) repeat protein